MADENSSQANSAQSDSAQNNSGKNNGADNQAVPRGLQIKRIFLKDLSFETPMGLEAFNRNWKPKIEQELNVQVIDHSDNHYEVVLLITATAYIEDKVAFLVEVKQAGLFAVSGLEQAQLSQVINTACPQVLFPYAREVIDSTLARGAFPPLMLPPINFDAVFAHAIQQAKQQREAQSSSEADSTSGA